MRVAVASVDLELLDHGVAQRPLGEHAFDGRLDDPGRVTIQDLLCGELTQTPRVAAATISNQNRNILRASTAPSSSRGRTAQLLDNTLRDPNAISAMWYQSYVDAIAKKKKDAESKKEQMLLKQRRNRNGVKERGKTFCMQRHI
jgi:hypothetical protein